MLTGKGDSPQYVLNNLDPERLRAARERAGITGRRLAELVGKTPSAISQFESGTTLPDLDTLVRLSMALGVPTTFFARRTGHVSVPFDRCHFRARRSVSQRDRRGSVRDGEILLGLVNALAAKGVVFPEEQLSTFRERRSPVTDVDDLEAAERAAMELRRHWGMGTGPVPHLVRLMESKGVFVFPLADAHVDVDAYSAWAGGRPCIMLAMAKTASRARFDAAHELAHLILHDDIDPGAATVERQADRFAGAFLAPRESFLMECPRRWSLPAFERLKDRWHLSVQALVRRGFDLGCLSQASYQRAFRDLSMLGLRRDEGPEWDHEQPTLLDQALGLLKGQIDLDELASELGLYPADLEGLLRRNAEEATILAIKKPRAEETAPLIWLDRGASPQGHALS
jgi:Zn-dependent peptidase ImmA (M78 family)/transcriptional regulator with XRE-family HTH domain